MNRCPYCETPKSFFWVRRVRGLTKYDCPECGKTSRISYVMSTVVNVTVLVTALILHEYTDISVSLMVPLVSPVWYMAYYLLVPLLPIAVVK